MEEALVGAESDASCGEQLNGFHETVEARFNRSSTWMRAHSHPECVLRDLCHPPSCSSGPKYWQQRRNRDVSEWVSEWVVAQVEVSQPSVG